MERLSITKFRNYVLIDLMVDLNITSCQASAFRIKLLWLYSSLEVSKSHISVCLCTALRKGECETAKLVFAVSHVT